MSEVKELVIGWLAALRSDNYKQGKCCLKTTLIDPGGTIPEEAYHCCLGVLCEIAKIPELGGHHNGQAIMFEDQIKGTTTNYLPTSLANKIQMDFGYQQELAKMNDNGLSFEEISNSIEKYYTQKGVL